jgi:hypothetical protein
MTGKVRIGKPVVIASDESQARVILGFASRKLKAVRSSQRKLRSRLQLRLTQLVIASAFEMQVISDDCFPRDAGIDDQRHATTKSFLERIDFRNEPMRAPEIGLLLKSNDAGIR